MNEFTKEELEHIKFGLLELSYIPAGLLTKIQSMIDNYCYHLETYTEYNYNAERCKKCFDFINEE